MKVNLFHKIAVLGYVLLNLANCQAQSAFQYKSSLSDIKSAGFYKITLSPSIVSKCKNELNDIRILNGKGIQVPYVLKSDQLQFQEKNFIELPIVDIKRETDKQTHVVIQNTLNKTIDELLLVIKNTDAERTVTISGSDDKQKWFVIKEHIYLNNLFIREQDRFIQSLSFPNSTYKFFEIIINGKDLLPVNIVKVGVYEGVLRNGNFINIPGPAIYQVDSSNKSSYVNITFDDNYLVNKLQLSVQGSKFFQRHLTILKDENNISVPINDYVLSSAIDPGYTVNAKTKRLKLIIENQDSPPLKVESVKAYQINKYLLTYLESSNEYQLVFGDSTTDAPKYDLEFFKDIINNSPMEAGVGPITKTSTQKVPGKQAGNGNMMILWIIIGSVLVLLLILTLRMTKEVSKKDKSEQL